MFVTNERCIDFLEAEKKRQEASIIHRIEAAAKCIVTYQTYDPHATGCCRTKGIVDTADFLHKRRNPLTGEYEVRVNSSRLHCVIALVTLAIGAPFCFILSKYGDNRTAVIAGICGAFASTIIGNFVSGPLLYRIENLRLAHHLRPLYREQKNLSRFDAVIRQMKLFPLQECHIDLFAKELVELNILNEMPPVPQAPRGLETKTIKLLVNGKTVQSLTVNVEALLGFEYFKVLLDHQFKETLTEEIQLFVSEQEALAFPYLIAYIETRALPPVPKDSLCTLLEMAHRMMLDDCFRRCFFQIAQQAPEAQALTIREQFSV